jgi:hypothetical protein
MTRIRQLKSRGRFALALTVLVTASLALVGGGHSQDAAASGVAQLSLASIERYPRLPQPFYMRNWREVARKLDGFVFDYDAKGEFFPMIWRDTAQRNHPQDTWGIPSYLGDNRQRGESHESITAIGAVLGSSLVGIRKDTGRYNHVRELLNYENLDNGMGVVLNLTRTTTGSNWYDLFPGMMFTAVSSLYPDDEALAAATRRTASRWREAVTALRAISDPPKFDFTYFDFTTMKPVLKQWVEPDASAGLAWLQFMQHARFGDAAALEAVDACLRFLEALPEDRSPFYEVMLPYGALVAARMNAEHGRNYNVRKYLHWIFEGYNYARPAWNVTGERWGNYDVHGLMSGVSDTVRYAFAFNTFNLAGALVPMLRYDQRFARIFGRWMLNLANNSKAFYPYYLPADNQGTPEYRERYANVFAYEGLRAKWGLDEPFATADSRRFGWAKTDFGIYGSVYVGMLGAMVKPTNDPRIFGFDLNATDFNAPRAYPTTLYYNPYAQARTVRLEVGAQPRSLYDTVEQRFVAENVTGSVAVTLEPDRSRIIVVTPASPLERRDGRTLVDGVVVDYRSAR